MLHNDALHALVDTFDGGDLVIAQTAFGLLEKKRLRWFHEDGQYMGSVVSKDPIRRVYSTAEGMAVETRRQRAIVQGVPTWWGWYSCRHSYSQPSDPSTTLGRLRPSRLHGFTCDELSFANS